MAALPSLLLGALPAAEAAERASLIERRRDLFRRASDRFLAREFAAAGIEWTDPEWQTPPSLLRHLAEPRTRQDSLSTLRRVT